jgi:type IV secretory pathway VirB4 component
MADTKNSQDFVPIKEIRDSVVVLKDNSLRGIILTSSVNFALKSADEQNAIIYQFQNFLNSINFSIQIFVESRRLDIRPYIALLENVRKDQQNELLQVQTKEYIEFIKSFTESVNIMTKSFFIVIPYIPAIIKTQKSALSSLLGRSEQASRERNETFEENRTQLLQRMEVVMSGLTRMGVRAIPLGTEEIVELYYKLFNPGDTEKPINLTEVVGGGAR